MSATIPQASSSDSETVQVRIVADNASEAVGVIKERFGGAAKVVSVKQQDGGGLKRLLKKPRLEILIEAPRSAIEGGPAKPKADAPASARPVEEPAREESSTERSDAASTQSKRAFSKPKTPVERAYSKGSSPTYFSEMDSTEAEQADSSAPLGTAANPVLKGTMEYVERAISMLKSVGFDDSLIERIRYELDFRSMGKLPTMEIYSRICDWLRTRKPDERNGLKGRIRAFVGGSGVGKTAALCKALSADVFANGLEPIVVKIDGASPNPSDGLEAFCEITGTPFYRSMEEVQESDPDRPIYVDLPGFCVSDSNAVAQCIETLGALEVDEAILVANAAYEADLIAEAMAVGARLGARHAVFTHLDETRRAGKLWKYALKEGARPLFFSYGSNPAGDYTMDPFSYLLEKTFPQGRSLASANPIKRSAASGDAANREAVANV